jgi:hypothetical protein
VLDSGTALDINNLPYNLGQKVFIPVEPVLRGCDGDQPYVGEVTISLDYMRNIPDQWSLQLRDKGADETVNLRDTTRYTFTLESSTSASTCSSTSSGATTQSTASGGTQAMPAVPTPQVVKHTATTKDGDPNTRFVLRIDPQGTLPVELSGFDVKANNQRAVLNWTTASETDNAGFEVQQRIDGQFREIGFVEGAGTTSESTDYRFRTDELEAGETYAFRLKQVDTDGSTSFSEIVELDIGLEGSHVLKAPYPNPFRDRATVEFAVKEAQDVTVAVYNTLGQRVRTLYQGSPTPDQMQTARFEGQGLSSGLYIVRMQGEDFTATRRVTLVK